MCDTYKQILSFFDHPYAPWHKPTSSDTIVYTVSFSLDPFSSPPPPSVALRLERCEYTRLHEPLNTPLNSTLHALIIYQMMKDPTLAPLLTRAPMKAIEVREFDAIRQLCIVYKEDSGVHPLPIFIKGRLHENATPAETTKRQLPRQDADACHAKRARGD